MDVRSTARTFLGALAAALVTGCGLGGSPSTGAVEAGSAMSVQAEHRVVPLGSTSKAARERLDLALAPRPSRSWFDRSITQNVFLADEANGVVDIFDFSSRRQSGEIVGFSSPAGLATDSAGNLYVADTLAQTIEVFAKPYLGNPMVLNDSGYFPVGVHVDARGNLYVANICSGSNDTCSGAGNTIEFAAGSQTPTTLAGGPGRAYFVSTDARGDVWVDGQTSPADPRGEIGYFSAGNGTFVPVGIALTFPGGMTFDRSGNLLLDDQTGAKNGGSILKIYKPGTTSPSSTIALQDEGDDIIDIALGTAQARIFAPDYFTSIAAIITYPAGLDINSLMPVTAGALDAVAVTPATRP